MQSPGPPPLQLTLIRLALHGLHPLRDLRWGRRTRPAASTRGGTAPEEPVDSGVSGGVILEEVMGAKMES